MLQCILFQILKTHLWRDKGMLTMFAAATATNGTNLWNSGGALYSHHTHMTILTIDVKNITLQIKKNIKKHVFSVL